MTAVIPARVKLAAKRAFVRTTAQAYAATIPAGGISAAVLLNVLEHPNPLAIAATVAAALLTPPLAGLAAYMDITAKGIPTDYQARR